MLHACRIFVYPSRSFQAFNSTCSGRCLFERCNATDSFESHTTLQYPFLPIPTH